MPEAQLDRFLLRLPIGYPSVDDENQMLLNLQRQHPIETLEQVLDDLVEKVPLDLGGLA